MEPSSTSALLTVNEVAVELRCSPDTVYRRIAAGELAATDISEAGSWKPKTRVPRAEVHAYIERKTRKVTPHTP